MIEDELKFFMLTNPDTRDIIGFYWDSGDAMKRAEIEAQQPIEWLRGNNGWKPKSNGVLKNLIIVEIQPLGWAQAMVERHLLSGADGVIDRYKSMLEDEDEVK